MNCIVDDSATEGLELDLIYSEAPLWGGKKGYLSAARPRVSGSFRFMTFIVFE